MLREVRLPLLPKDARFGFYEFSRRAGDYAIAMALTTYRLKDGVIVEPHVGVGGAEGRPRRIAEAEAALAGRTPGAEVFRAAGEAAAAAVDPLEDVHADAEFRRDLVRAVTQTIGRERHRDGVIAGAAAEFIKAEARIVGQQRQTHLAQQFILGECLRGLSPRPH